MMKLNNIEIRQEIEHKRLKYYEVARAIGITPVTLSVWLQEELTPERKERVRHAIETIEI